MNLQPQVTTIKNSKGLEAEISNLGASLLSLKVLDKENNPINVIVGLEKPEDYLGQEYLNNYNCLGASVGRWAGRISGGKFKIEREEYPLYNEDGVHLHGGKEGFSKKYWTIEKVVKNSVTLSYVSVDLEEGYPGNLKVTAHYELTENNALKIVYKATTDKTTPVNLTNHSYFNLEGYGSILDHELELKSDKYVELNEKLLVTGNFIETNNSSYDFSDKSIVGKKGFTGLDDVFVLNVDASYNAVLASSKTGIEMKVHTNQPTLVVYTPIQLPDLSYKNNANFAKYSAICFEAEAYPDAPNQSDFPSALLHPGEIYLNETIFEFSIQ
ncbi:galactose mutarotase [Aureibaculum sp. A20]|uniref:Aldose 1-epimerase n=1 Tax=Aureibaculum flavum TaxID=2795986 RepID=A0ABS0WRY2_9FLAO|nr:aldose epimerase family protein [Aureibaculum flavum]MBJ2174694.1 galactose mutarotase [Aureibaculum flavum]